MAENSTVLPFDASLEFARVFLYDLPALLLILYLLFRNRPAFSAGFPRPRIKDLLTTVVVVAALILVAAGISFVFDFFPQINEAPIIEPPRGAAQWFAVMLSCASTGYLEETYFRAYLLTRFEEAGIELFRRVFVSAVLFTICHLYEGFWGMLNAALAAIVFSIAYYSRRSIHGPAWAHAIYNAIVYAIGS